MSNKLTRVIITILCIIATASVMFLCHKGFIGSDNLDDKFSFSESAARCFFLLLFVIIYHSSFSISLGLQSRFLSLYLLFSICSELRILSPAESAASVLYIDPMVSVKVVLFSTFMMIFSLAGYGLYYSSHETSSMSRYLLCSAVCSLAITVFVPKVSDTMEIWTLTPLRYLSMLLFASIAVIFLILLFTDAPGYYLIRHVAGLILCVANALNLFFNTQVMNLAATVMTIIGLLIILIIVRKGDVKL